METVAGGVRVSVGGGGVLRCVQKKKVHTLAHELCLNADSAG